MATYADVLAMNLRAARARRGLDQEPLAARMRALGYSAWRRQTVANVEKGARRLTAEEMLGLAVALETSLVGLLEPVMDDKMIEMPSGHAIPVIVVHELIWGGSEYSVTWQGEIPAFPADRLPETRGYALPPPRMRRR